MAAYRGVVREVSTIILKLVCSRTTTMGFINPRKTNLCYTAQISLDGEHEINPYEDSNTLIEQSGRLKYSNIQYILHRLTRKPLLDTPLA